MSVCGEGGSGGQSRKEEAAGEGELESGIGSSKRQRRGKGRSRVGRKKQQARGKGAAGQGVGSIWSVCREAAVRSAAVAWQVRGKMQQTRDDLLCNKGATIKYTARVSNDE